MHVQALPATPASRDTLAQRIGPLCQIVRLLAALYAGWTLVTITWLWADPARLTRAYAGLLGADTAGIGVAQRLAGFAVHFSIWCLVAAACFSAWRLFSGFLSGAIFTREAAIWLRRVGLFGIAAEVLDLLARPLLSLIVTLHRGAGQKMISVSFNQPDLAFLMFLTALVALAHVQKAAAEIAEENEGIV